MHIKHIHEMIEKLADCAKSELAKGIECVDTEEMGAVTDMLKDLCQAEYYATIVKEMKEYKEDEEAEEKYLLRMFKEENKDEYKRMREQYGEEDGERRFYDSWRYADGRFAPKGSGSYRPRSYGRSRRGYQGMMPIEGMAEWEHDPEYWRDMDRDMGRMHYSGAGSSGGNMGGMSGNRSGGLNSDNSGNYGSDGRRNYDGEGRNGSRSTDESRYDRARRGYEETKALHTNKTPDDERENMRSLETLFGVVDGDIRELKPNMSPSEKAMAAQKFDTWSRMMKQ